MIRVVLPLHLRRLANVDKEVEVAVKGQATFASVLDALELAYPMLQGTIRDHVSKERRPYVRYFACGMDFSHESTDMEIPALVQDGVEPLRIVGAMSGG
ncbi:hypothetical protein EG832_13000 [bacterium]|nr:hypothetical protein [bacterium]